MAWTVEEVAESKPLPILKLEKDVPVRLRILGPQIMVHNPPIPEDSLYAKGTWDKAKHFPPDDVKIIIGARPCDCIGIRNGCIFHDGLLAWDTTYDNLINVVVYDGVNAKEKTYTDSFIIGMNMKLSLWKNMGEQLGLLGLEKSQLWAVDWIIVKTGEGQYNTKYNCTAITDSLDQVINLEDFPAQEEFGDSEFPMLIDFRKFYPNPLTTPQQQEEWYNTATTKAALKNASDNIGTPRQGAATATVMQGRAPGLPGATQTALPASPQLPGLAGMRNITPQAAPAPITMQSGEKKRGRPAGSSKNTTIPVAQLNPTITQGVSPLANLQTFSLPPAPPPVGNYAVTAGTAANVRAAYDTACAVLDPWGVALKDSEYLQFIIDATPEQLQEYAVTAEVLAAAKLVKAGPPTEQVLAKPTLPKLPGQGLPAAGSSVPSTALPAASELDTLRGDLTKIIMSLPVFKSPMNIMSFLKLFYPDGTIKTVRQISDVAMLQQIIESANQGNDVIAGWLSAPQA